MQCLKSITRLVALGAVGTLFGFHSLAVTNTRPALSSLQNPPTETARLVNAPLGNPVLEVPLPQNSFRDSLGDTYYVLDTATSEDAQKAIDHAFEKIFSTTIGLDLCRLVLAEKSKEAHQLNLRKHLGISIKVAERIVGKCRYADPVLPSFFFIPSKESDIQRKRLAGSRNVGDGFKNYTFLLTRGTKWNYDSWTDASNQTFIVIEDPYTENTLSSQNDELHLIRVLAHEIAVYFDVKQSTDTNEWREIIELSISRLSSYPYLEEFALALSNPLIQQVLTTWRAYIFERLVLEEVLERFPSLGKFTDTAIDSKYDFLLDSKCNDDCLFDHLRIEAEQLTEKALFFSVLRPNYRNRKWKQVQQELYAKDNELRSALIDYPNKLLGTYLSIDSRTSKFSSALGVLDLSTPFSYSDFFYLLIDPAIYQANIVPSYVTAQQYKRILLPSDLRRIWLTSIKLQSSNDLGVISFLKNPLLGATNVNSTYGPRPRIRTGSIGGGAH
ncbi:MAG: hypothetical protein KDD61_03840 [Bdellovibrionales bacterium]|nr:hypothetical protein [Bdellovibrionales bacterium]